MSAPSKKSVYRNTLKEYERAVKAGELTGNDKAAARAMLDQMEAREYFRKRDLEDPSRANPEPGE